LLPEPQRAAEVAAWIKEVLAPVLAGLDKGRRHGFGEDFARVGDLTVLPVLEEGQDTILRVRLVVEIGNCPFSQQKQVIGAIGDGLPRFHSAAFDATGNGADIAEWAADKWGRARIAQIKLSDSFYLENMPRFKAALEDATLDELPQDDQCRDDLRAIKRINGIPKLERTKTQRAGGEGKRVQRHGDFAIGLFLGHFAMKRDVAPIEFTSAPSRASRWDGRGSDEDDDIPCDTDTGAY
jgi:phage FluMu gp28-like protein